MKSDLFNGGSFKFFFVCLLSVLLNFEMSFAKNLNHEDILLKGIVSDALTGEPLIGASLVVEGTMLCAVTDLQGRYELVIPQGVHKVCVSYLGYHTVELTFEAKASDIESVRSYPDQPLKRISENMFEILMRSDSETLDNAVVTARKNSESLKVLQNERIESGYAIENLGSEEMSIKGISNAQEGLAKMSGISIATAGQLIVRGLGDRYSTTTLNGMPIASPNPDSKLIPLDIFPASAIGNITVSKVYEASSFADYSGAHVDISTKRGRNEDFINLTFSSGGYAGTIFGDSHSMSRPSLFLTPQLSKTAENIPYSEFGAYSRENEIFSTSFNVYSKKALPDMNMSVGYGKNFKLGGHNLNVLASLSVKSGSETIEDAYYRTYEASSVGNMQTEFDYDSYCDKLDIAALLNMDYMLSDDDNLVFNAFFARNAKSTYLERNGYDYLESYALVGHNQVSHFYMLQDYQLKGFHRYGLWNMDWGLSCNLTSSDEPDRRQVMFIEGDGGMMSFFQLNQQETQRFFGKLGENEVVADFKAAYSFDDDNKLRLGITAKGKSRFFKTTRFYYNLQNFNDPIPDIYNLDDYMNFDNIRNGLITIDRKQHSRDRYDAFSAIAAAFVEGDLRFGRNWFLNVGLRFEASRQSIDYNDDVENKTRILDAFDLFPAINLKYGINERNLLRLSVSRTVTRPSFVEMAPFLYQESFGGVQVRGNENLVNGYNYNIDLKYELFAKGNSDMLAVTGYFKYLDKPIERVQRLSGGAAEHSFNNADNGIAAGIEAEIRKTIIPDLVFYANASYMYTNVVLPAGGAYTNQERSLQGASPYLVNASISWTPRFKNDSRLNLTAMYNLQGPRIHAVGIMGIGDVKQMPFHSLDFVAGYNIDKYTSVKFTLSNILCSPVVFTQDIPNAGRTVDVESWNKGIAFNISFSWTL